jgi:hypothetical protein
VLDELIHNQAGVGAALGAEPPKRDFQEYAGLVGGQQWAASSQM